MQQVEVIKRILIYFLQQVFDSHDHYIIFSQLLRNEVSIASTTDISIIQQDSLIRSYWRPGGTYWANGHNNDDWVMFFDNNFITFPGISSAPTFLRSYWVICLKTLDILKPIFVCIMEATSEEVSWLLLMNVYSLSDFIFIGTGTFIIIDLKLISCCKWRRRNLATCEYVTDFTLGCSHFFALAQNFKLNFQAFYCLPHITKCV